ncbi:hypothetical protein ACFSWE_07315 [Leucobacter albus]|uniref:Excreted virulence factor EspC (Type VII ESX diderm) n=1 Tax=Leucobacter albus TaxID=272210 RepID=A0ABW3TJW3_9MICO
MTEIYVDRDGMERRLGTVLERVDAADRALGKMPAAPDGGIATSLIAFIAGAGAEAAVISADLARLLSAVTIDVVDDMAATDSQIAAELRDMEQDLESR